MKISAILDKVDDKQLFVPAFQREYVWDRADAKQLVDSLIKEYPTGTLLLWETSSPPELKGPHKYDPKQGAIRVLLDGQQRVTTLYMLVRGEVPPYYTLAEVKKDPRGLYVNLETLELSYFVRTKMEGDPRWQNVTDVFQGKVDAFGLAELFSAAGTEVGIEDLKVLNRNVNAITSILDREFPEQTIPAKATIREAIDIFYIVNSSGVTLTDAELALAQISGYWPQARDLFKKKLSDLEKDGFVFRLDWLMYVLLGCLHHVGSDMRKLHGPENNQALRAAWQRLDKQVLDYVVNLLRSSAYVDHSTEINSVYALVPIIAYCFDKGGKHPTDAEIRKMVKWFYYSQVRARYASQLPQKLDRDLRAIKESAEPFDDMLQAIVEEGGRLEITPTEFEGRAIQHPLFSMVRWYFKSRGAICFTTGLALRQNMGAKYKLENDHIFPYSRLKKAGYGEENRFRYALAQELTNRAILTQIGNRTKSDDEAASYLQEVQERFPKALDLQCVPEDSELWKIENYEAFLHDRRTRLARELTDFLGQITMTDAIVAPVTLEQRIAEGESDGLEFKSTLRWDLVSQMVNSRLEDVVAKTVAAFANAQGGALVIGVDDDGSLVGLEPDFATLDGGDRDKFELHLRNLLAKEFGQGFVAAAVRVSFAEIGGLDVCRIEVSPASEPVILKVKGKDGQPAEKFYVRSGNSSRELPMGELKAYWDQRFA